MKAGRHVTAAASAAAGVACAEPAPRRRRRQAARLLSISSPLPPECLTAPAAEAFIVFCPSPPPSRG